jgi:pyruvate dehydrogenase E2 component (dihydrolipoamide acetyltransferase)
MNKITMPQLSDSMQEGTILTWFKADGDAVAEGEELLEIETDKATMAYESPAAGTLKIVAEVGQTLAVGSVIATVGDEVSAESGPATDAEPATEPEQATEPEPEPAADRVSPEALPATGNGSFRATPLARRLARAHGVDLAALRGSGPRGRITRSDVEVSAGVQTAVEPPPPPAQSRRSSEQSGQTQELTRLQQVVARRMAQAKATVPHFQVQTEAQMDALIALRGELKALGGRAAPVPSVNDFIVKACALALREHPRANGSYDDGRFVLHQRVNVGIAVAAPDALVVPTITDADTRPLGEIAIEARRLAQRVRDSSITPPELSGATFTVSNLGMYAMTAITPVINPPQAAILGVGALRAVPALDGGQLIERQLMTLTLSCDHRILYGADAAQFLSDIRDALEQPLRLLI